MTVDRLWFLANRAAQRGEQAYHRLRERHEGFIELERTRHVSRQRFRTLAERINRSGAPYGAHTVVYRPSGELLLVRHEGVDKWVLPGGGVDDCDDDFRETAARELAEEAGIEATYEGLAMLTKLTIRSGGHQTTGVLPIFAARPCDVTLDVRDPDGEISAARWFDDLPADTRDRAQLKRWRQRSLGVA
ncbi:NUDIX hydrolase [Halospeciosus flavus]|uniref:NUDIX hydrolase n=1 Tax=Halospeciosus flavus TaxID=3032283 RepID=A0ABD5Z2A5_9EURY|nr:NUDIX domain-containing protein [Halospeciosus flavus]